MPSACRFLAFIPSAQELINFQIFFSCIQRDFWICGWGLSIFPLSLKNVLPEVWLTSKQLDEIRLQKIAFADYTGFKNVLPKVSYFLHLLQTNSPCFVVPHPLTKQQLLLSLSGSQLAGGRHAGCTLSFKVRFVDNFKITQSFLVPWLSYLRSSFHFILLMAASLKREKKN